MKQKLISTFNRFMFIFMSSNHKPKAAITLKTFQSLRVKFKDLKKKNLICQP